ncbi:hypothetical protein BDU57DRAFT_519143 [Ampelomyces quisqualis]|uniref:Uncharacterized protein n=1 Tax=Ampelomyces quisqualis TaxID=50730 RepID=A0A6A5QFY2_AMPQU|nr:hypothetical protein BDU57DRAFT_519143 [Ampelomyces quisqualis]
MARDRPATRAPANHARLHKRGQSASSLTSPLSPARNSASFTFNRSETPKTTYEEPWTEPQRPMPTATPSHQLKIKPYLRKLSSKDNSSNGLDLSRPAAENEGLAGLGIAEYGGYSRSISDVTFTPVHGRHRHTRSTSNTSQFSTSSGGLQRPTPLPPIRQTPHSFVSPTSLPDPSPVLGSEQEADDIMSDDEFRMRQNAYDPGRRSGSLSSAPGTSLRIHTNNSSTRLAASYSQSSVSLTSPVLPSRSRGDTLKSIDTATSPSSRTSFDHATRFIRGGRDSPVDAASRAASIRAAREKFEADQRAKEAKYEKEAHKQAERDFRKQQKKEEIQTRRSEAHYRVDHSRSRSVSDAQNEKSLRPSVGGRQYSDHRQAHSNSLPKYVATTTDVEKQSGAAPQVTKSRAVKGRWLRFVTWFKTRLLRMSRKVPR